jgi:uncharacterized membrane protein
MLTPTLEHGKDLPPPAGAGAPVPREAPLPWRVLLALAAAEGAGLALAVQGLAGWRWMAPFVAQNQLGHGARSLLLASIVGGALLAVVGALAWWLRAGRWQPVERAVRAAAPLTILWAALALMNPGAYEGRELELLLAAAVLVAAGERCARSTVGALAAATSPPRARGREARGPWLALAALVVASSLAISALAIRVHHKMLTSIFDLGLFENLFFNVTHGAHGRAVNFNYFAQHAELLVYPLLPLYWIAPRAETLLVVQSAALGLTAVPVFLLGRRWLRSGWQALLLAAAFTLHPAVHGPSLYEFHFLTLSVLFIAWAAYFLVARRWLPLAIAATLAMACREDVALGFALVGTALAWMGWRRRASLVLGGAGLLWFLLVKFVWIARFGGASFSEYYEGLIPAGEHGFGGVVRTLLSNPLYVVGTMLTREKLVLALQLVVPLAFLPLRQVRTAVLLLPGMMVVGLSTSRAAVVQISFQYVCHFLPYLFIATTAALAVRRRPQRLAALSALALGTAIATAQFGMFVRDRFHSGFQTFSLAWTAEDARRLQDARALAALIPPTASVSAGEHDGPHVARRRVLMTLKGGVQGADYVFFGLRSLRWGGKEAVLAALETHEYGVVERRGAHVLLKRGAPATTNAEVAAWLRTADPNQ